MTTAGISHGARKKVFDFLYHDINSMPLRANDSTGFVSTFENGGLKVTLGAAAGNGSIDLGGTGILAADLLAFEALVKLEAIADDATICIGMAGAFNADPDVIAQNAWFKVIGDAVGANSHTVVVETDDGTTDIDDEPTGKTLVIDAWARLRVNFSTGIQSISLPAKSKGGLGSVQFFMPRTSQDNMFLSPLQLTKHMDMAAIGDSVVLQPMIHGVAGSIANTELLVKELCVEYRTH